MLGRLNRRHRTTLEADKRPMMQPKFVADLREINVALQVAQNTIGARQSMDAPPAVPGYAVSMCIRKRIDERFSCLVR